MRSLAILALLGALVSADGTLTEKECNDVKDNVAKTSRAYNDSNEECDDAKKDTKRCKDLKAAYDAANKLYNDHEEC